MQKNVTVFGGKNQSCARSFVSTLTCIKIHTLCITTEPVWSILPVGVGAGVWLGVVVVCCLVLLYTVDTTTTDAET